MKILVVYGGGSIKRNGVYDRVMTELKKIDANVFELSGVEPNPRLTTVRKGVEICKTEGIDFILAVGGGSVIDCTKAISAGAKYEGDAWDLIKANSSDRRSPSIWNCLNLSCDRVRNEFCFSYHELGNE